MLLESWLALSSEKLKLVDIKSYRLDCLIMLEDVLEKDRSWALANPDYKLTAKNIRELDTMLEARLEHIPIAYIRGRCEFYGREFTVSISTLQPRPETEIMIEMLLELNLEPKFVILDIGTGSGCIAITAKLELPNNKLIASDISEEALSIAKINCEKFKADVNFIKNDLLEGFEYIQNPSVILSNLPYVPAGYPINKPVEHEPRLALFGGLDGLELYRKMFYQTLKFKMKPRLILTESLINQHNELDKIALSNGYRCIDSKDLIQVFKSI